jgi:hypothetical protein
MKLFALLVAVSLAGFGSCSVKSQTLESPNLITSGQNHTWTNVVNSTTTGGGFSGGNKPAYNVQNGLLYFGYTQATVSQTYAFNQALQNSGMSILGYNYSWQYLNQGQTSGTLSANVNFAGVDGSSLHSKNWTLGPTTEWTTVQGTETFNNALAASQIANFSLSFSGKDSRFWAGYYGPQVARPSLSLNYTFDQCSSNPLSSPTCPGYAAAYQTQQCTINALYNSACPGYAVAYQIQQCTINPLTDPSCPGYAAAYLTQQCRTNPLYSTVCEGYQTAYHDQQCIINPLFASDCTGYATAYKTQQCTASPLYATDCPGYDQAYLNAQCIRDSLYSNKCEGYATAYAIKNLIKFSDSTISSSVNQSLSNTAAVKANDPSNTVVPTNTASTTVSTDGTVSTGVSTTGDTNVDKAITSKASTTNTAPAAVQLAPPPPAPQSQMAQGGNNKQEDKKDDAQKGTVGGPSPQNTNNAQSPSDKPAAPTARQELQARREAAAKAEAVEKGKNLANEMGKAADMESQKQIQNVVIQAMGFTPGFDTYSKTIMNDVVGYKPYSVYNNQKNIDNRANLRMFGGTDRLHNEMVESQYKGN